MIEYNNDNYPYYKNENNKITLSDDIKQNNKTNNYKLTEDIAKVNINDYKNKYLFGEFSKIFKPNMNNEEIADNMETIKEKIKNNQPLFIIGYGASGAGKTSSLIYFNKNEENGILINLCNQLGSMDGEDGNYNKIELSCKEFYHTDKEQSLSNPEHNDVSNNGLPIEFIYNGTEFVLNDDYKHSTHHQYRLRKKDVSGNATNEINNETNFNKGSPLGKVIIHLIDTDRFVKATTNNPNSSRSHTLVFVKLLGKDKYANIIIGDFAGVENTFACENPNTIKAFLNVKRDNVKDKNGKPIPYYSTEAYNGNPDPIGILNNEKPEPEPEAEPEPEEPEEPEEP
jgi:hypothetical protein